MIPVLVDSNVILDVATSDVRWAPWSTHALAREADRARLVINPIVYAEVSVGYSTIEETDTVLASQALVREPLPYAAAFLVISLVLLKRRDVL